MRNRYSKTQTWIVPVELNKIYISVSQISFKIVSHLLTKQNKLSDF